MTPFHLFRMPPKRPGLSPRRLELFRQMLIKNLDLNGAAKEAGMSISTANQHVAAVKNHYNATSIYYVIYRLVKDGHVPAAPADFFGPPRPMDIEIVKTLIKFDGDLYLAANELCKSLTTINQRLIMLRKVYSAKTTANAVYYVICDGYIDDNEVTFPVAGRKNG